MDNFVQENLTELSEKTELDHTVQGDTKSPENPLQSPLGISRYGRTRKPKITQDFCDIDDAIECTDSSGSITKRTNSNKNITECTNSSKNLTERTNTSKNITERKNSSKSISERTNSSKSITCKRSQAKIPTKSPRKFKSYVSKSNENVISFQDDAKTKRTTVPRFPKILHVTGDSESYENVDMESDVSSVSSVKSPESTLKIRKFFKTSAEGMKLQTMTQLYISKTNPVYAPKKGTVKIESALKLTNEKIFATSAIDVSKVLKIFSSSKPNQLKEPKTHSKSTLKTYTNKRKHFNKPVGIESFGLPDEPIIPLNEEICVKPLRISEIDVVDIPEADNINLTDAWQTKIEEDDDMLTNINSIQEVDIRKLPEKPENQLSIDVEDEEFECIYEEKCKSLQNKDTIQLLLVDADLNSTTMSHSSSPVNRTIIEKFNDVTDPTLEEKGDESYSNECNLLETKNNNKEVACNLNIVSSKSHDSAGKDDIEIYEMSCAADSELIPQEAQTPNKSTVANESNSDSCRSQELNIIAPVNTSNSVKKSLTHPTTINKKFDNLENSCTDSSKALSVETSSVTEEPELKRRINHFKRKTKTFLKRSSVHSRFASSLKLPSTSIRNVKKLKRKHLFAEMSLNCLSHKAHSSSKIKRKILKAPTDSSIRRKRTLVTSRAKTSKPKKCVSSDSKNFVLLESPKKQNSGNKNVKEEALVKPGSKFTVEKKTNSPSKHSLRSSLSISDDDAWRLSKDDGKHDSKGNGKLNSLLDESVTSVCVPNTKVLKKVGVKEGKRKKPSVPVEIAENSVAQQHFKKPPAVNTDACEYKLGDVMWAKLGSHPYWPCLISEEPKNSMFRKRHKRLTMYHVRFFGDNGRRSWVPEKNLLTFTGRHHVNGVQNTHNLEDKNDTSILPPRNEGKYINWTIGIAEAESLMDKTVAQRFHFFFEMFASKKEKKRLEEENLPSQNTMPRFSLGVTKSQPKTAFSKQRSNSLPLNIVKIAKKTEAKGAIKDGRRSINERQKIEKRVTRASLLRNAVETSSLLKGEKKTSEDREIISKELSEIVQSGHSKQSTPQRDVLGSEYSLSDTDSSSKFSGNSPIPFTLESQAALHKRNNLFRGVTRERVCQKCEKTRNIIKCKGRCSGYYHVNCAREIKKLEVSDPEVDGGTEKHVTMNMQEVQINSTADKSETSLLPDDKEKSDFKNVNEVEIIQIKDRRKTGSLPKLVLNPDLTKLPLFDQIDHKMKEVMEKFEDKTLYADSTTDYTSSEESLPDSNNGKIHLNRQTVDNVSSLRTHGVKSKNNECSKNNADFPKTSDTPPNDIDFKCNDCLLDVDPVCFVCHEELSRSGSSIRQKCSIFPCGKFYHPECLKTWPQTQWSVIATMQHKQSNQMLDTFVCPVHVCHTCVSDDPRTAISRCPSDKVVKCLRCPATYHTNTHCVPAGTEILTTTQIVCPRHLGTVGKNRNKKSMLTINTTWCFICSRGGDLICCETCPTSVHVDCLEINLLEDDTFICEDCETGRFPLYDEIVWVKLGTYRWWPAVILFPNEIPDNIKSSPHSQGEFVVKFFGTYDHYWIGRGRVFLFQEGDTGGQSISVKKRVDAVFLRSVEEASEAHRLKKDFKVSKEAEIKTGLKPPPFIKIKINRPVGNVRQFDGNISNTTPCECNPKQTNPCGPDSDCLNRLLMTECDPEVCPAGEKCQNQNFEERKYPPLVPYKTQGRGWGLKSLEPIKKGQFVIEYVGELIDEQEYKRRIKKMHEQKEENYYFLTIDKDRMIDAGPKGNVARFMNHSCQPNCETQKWTVNGDTRVGLFANVNIDPGTELTFNYNLECVGKERKICKCGAINCSGFIGLKAKLDESQKKPKTSLKKLKFKKKKRPPTMQVLPVSNDPCFVCGKTGNVGTCYNKICTKFYHVKCVNLKSWPDNKWVCPWHNCNVCSKRTIRCCVKCISSYCPVHSEGNIRYDKLLGFVCLEHDPSKESHEIQLQNTSKQETIETKSTEESDVTSTTCDEIVQSTAATKNQPQNLFEKHQSNRQKYNASPRIKKGKSTVVDASTSTPIKGDNSSFVEELEAFSNENDTCNKRVDGFRPTRKRGRPPKVLVETHKKIKLDKKGETKTTIVKPQNPTPNLITAYSVQNEVILSSTVPSRHLRASKVTNDVEENDRFLKRQREYEKDLPIRKRSTLRCETTI